MPHPSIPPFIWFTELIRVDQQAWHITTNCFFSPSLPCTGIRESKAIYTGRALNNCTRKNNNQRRMRCGVVESRRITDLWGGRSCACVWMQGMKWNYVLCVGLKGLCRHVHTKTYTRRAQCSVHSVCLNESNSFCVCEGMNSCFCRHWYVFTRGLICF